jgi:outer membrane protein
MKKNVYLIAGFTLFLFVLSNSAFAVDKIGFINTREIIQNSNVGKKAASDFKDYAEKKSAPVKALGQELQKMKEELDRQGSVMTDTSRRDKESAFQKKTRDYQLMVQDANDELQRKEQEVFQKLIPEILKIVRNIAEKEKYSLVIDIATMPVPYFAKENEFSKKVIEEYNKK